jgi:hypothetical protein
MIASTADLGVGAVFLSTQIGAPLWINLIEVGTSNNQHPHAWIIQHPLGF